MGVGFLAAALGNKLPGFFDPNNSATLLKLYGGIALCLFASAAVLAVLTPKIKKLMGKVNY